MHEQSQNRFAKLAPMKDALHLFTRLVLSDLPPDARVLCVGVGSGAELIYLAQAFPDWRFTAVEPVASAMEVCRERSRACGVASRCTFHEGYLDSLPETEPFHAATCILVSHYLPQPDGRSQLFGDIAGRLGPNGVLVNVDLAADRSASTYDALFQTWLQSWRYSGLPEEVIKKRSAGLAAGATLVSPVEFASVVESCGFSAPVQFFQALLIHAWFSKRAANVEVEM